jgi:hypothetical protein
MEQHAWQLRVAKSSQVSVCVTCGVVCAPVVQGTPRSISQGNFVTGSNSESTPAMQAGSRVVLKQVPAGHDKYRRCDEQKVCCDQQQSQRRSKFHETTRHDTTRRDTKLNQTKPNQTKGLICMVSK